MTEQRKRALQKSRESFRKRVYVLTPTAFEMRKMEIEASERGVSLDTVLAEREERIYQHAEKQHGLR